MGEAHSRLDSPPGASYYHSFAHPQTPSFIINENSPRPGFPRRGANEPKTRGYRRIKEKVRRGTTRDGREPEITNYSGLRKQDLIFRIEQSLLDTDTVLRGEGVLEILRKVTDSSQRRLELLYGPDDIYVSPSQIKRFDCAPATRSRSGAAAERGRALPRAAEGRSRQREEPEKAKHRVAFDNLRPRYPDSSSVGAERRRLVDAGVDILSPIGKGQPA